MDVDVLRLQGGGLFGRGQGLVEQSFRETDLGQGVPGRETGRGGGRGPSEFEQGGGTIPDGEIKGGLFHEGGHIGNRFHA